MYKRFLVSLLAVVLAGVLLPAGSADAQAPTYITQWGTYGTGNGQLDFPQGVATDNVGRYYVSDWGNNRIQVYGSGVVPAQSTSWGRIKSLYR
jgi:hypothetical protein